MINRLLRPTLLIVLLMTCTSVWASRVSVPVRIEHEYLQQALIAQVYTDADQTARVWDDGGGCNFLVLDNPHIDAQQGKLQITNEGIAKIGTTLGSQCVTLLDWKGTIKVLLAPFIEQDGAVLHFKVVDSHISDAGGGEQLTTSRLWGLVKQHVHPQMAQFTVDLRPTVSQLRALLPTVFPQARSAQIAELLASLSFTDANVTDSHVALALGFHAPELKPQAAVPEPEPALSPDELVRWNEALKQWDAFLTYIIGHAAADTPLQELRLTLLEVLVDARYELSVALTEPRTDGQDRMRALFVKTWDSLAPVLRRVSEGLPADTALRYITFVSAADALRAIDQLGPQVGLELSVHGLRRLARILNPDQTTDPLRYSLEVDPALRKLFGFGPPLPPPQKNPTPDPMSWLFPAAWADAKPARELITRLNRWVPQREELPIYLPMVRDLLYQSSNSTLASDKLDQSFHPLYRHLVLTTAWQETCWRHFIRKGKTIKPIESGTGSVGLMQVNERVWRGFYDVTGLRNDIGYNASAGSEILLHYLVDYAIKKGEHDKTGSRDNLVRATYAVYNGGPRHLRRYRKASTSKTLKKIDASFWDKYRTIKSGDELAVIRCFGESLPAAKSKIVTKTPTPSTRAEITQPTISTTPTKKISSNGQANSNSAAINREQWVLSLNPEHFTVQLLTAQNEPSIKEFMATHQLSTRAAYYAFSRKGRTWYAVIYGSFATRTEADKAAKSLTGRVKGITPWIRKLADIQQTIRTARIHGSVTLPGFLVKAEL